MLIVNNLSPKVSLEVPENPVSLWVRVEEKLKVKYYSEILDRLFDSEANLKAAELEFEQKKQEKIAKVEALKKADEIKQKEKLNKKKELASNVTKATETLNEMRENYKVINEEACRVIKEAYNIAEGMLKPAKEAVEKAERERYEAIRNYNKICGQPYTEVYTGDRALDELKKNISWFGNIFDFMNF